jgi:hypothetical protein
MKNEVYSWRLSTDLKSALEEAARREQVSVSGLLERIAREWLKTQPWVAEDEAEQERIRAAAAPYIGSISGDDPELSEKVRERVIEQLAKKYPR